MLPAFKSLNNGYKLPIVSFISSFRQIYLLRKVAYRILLLAQIVWCQPAQHRTYSIARSIGFNPNMLLHIKMSKDRSFDKGPSELEKDFFSIADQETR